MEHPVDRGDAGENREANRCGPTGPNRRQVLAGIAGVTLGGTGVSASFGTDAQGQDPQAPAKKPAGKSPWGDETYKEPTPAPVSVRPGEQELPASPRRYTDIKSYHAHIYFDEDSHAKAALLRRWVAERFEVELGNWNREPRGPHVTPSFYFGFTNDLLPILVPWLQLNSLGLTILLHPNTEDPRADHLYYALWINRTQPVNAFGMRKPAGGQPAVEQIYPNTKPSVQLET
ncbi:MAG: DOPA 4,5-dioxygenase family protein [Planctomycetes bacterium]|nr:DOPA 4,5-dioxygenase family protein [Planctomycetota bacterium]